VSSRNTLSGLVAREGARRLDLEVLPATDAARLFRTLLGERAEEDPASITALVELCDRLPLALRILAETGAARSSVPLSHLVCELGDHRHRLGLLDAGDDRRASVRSVFSWSVRTLPRPTARVFRVAGLHPAAAFDSWAVAALADRSETVTRRELDRLLSCHLVEPAGDGRYRMHDLLRAYARQLAEDHDQAAERRAASIRLLDHYVAAAAAAMDRLYPAEAARRRAVVPVAVTPPVADRDAALRWLNTERSTLTAISAYAAGHQPAGAVALSELLFRYLDAGGHHDDARTVHTHARRAARQLGDPSAEANAVISLGGTHLRQNRFDEAAALYRDAIDQARAAGGTVVETRGLASLGLVLRQQGRFAEAAINQERVLALFRAPVTGPRPHER
jgi:tetratricopeptide (TPR) repeat protein